MLKNILMLTTMLTSALIAGDEDLFASSNLGKRSPIQDHTAQSHPSLRAETEAAHAFEEAAAVLKDAADGMLLDMLHNKPYAVIAMNINRQLSLMSPEKIHELGGVDAARAFVAVEFASTLECLLIQNFGPLFNQTTISLSNLKLTGPIPDIIRFFTNATEIYLDDNKLTGPIPEALSSLLNLEILNLENNQLSGEIPNSLGHLQNLNMLTFAKNNLSGRFPASIFQLPNLAWLEIQENPHLYGEIPVEFFNKQKQENNICVLFNELHRLTVDEGVYHYHCDYETLAGTELSPFKADQNKMTDLLMQLIQFHPNRPFVIHFDDDLIINADKFEDDPENPNKYTLSFSHTTKTFTVSPDNISEDEIPDLTKPYYNRLKNICLGLTQTLQRRA